MRAACHAVWTRFTYASSFLDPDGFLKPGMPRGYLASPAIRAVARERARGAPDAVETIMLALAAKAASMGQAGAPSLASS